MNFNTKINEYANLATFLIFKTVFDICNTSKHINIFKLNDFDFNI